MPNEISEIAEDDEDEDVKNSDKRMAILVVEDNNDMRLYVRSVLSDKYLVYEARDGMDGLTQLAEHDIDFIIADLMMPVMDGLEFSKRVKQNFSFSHIPILILTANPDDNLRTEGYKIGVESYLNKPFDEQMLMARIAGILEGRKMNQHRFQATLNTDDLNLDSETSDDKFIRNVIEHVKEHFSDPDYAIEEILKEMQRRPEVTFSVKMRLGQELEEEGLSVMPIINKMPLVHVTLHPRLGRQQYKGTADREAFARFLEVCRHPMVYNGDVVEVENGERGMENIKGIMFGRGLLARPWMLGDKDPHEVVKSMHAIVYCHATENLCGDSQILSRLHAFWEYLDIPHMQKKAIMKATTLTRYREALAALQL